jgi:hypothetical protein
VEPAGAGSVSKLTRTRPTVSLVYARAHLLLEDKRRTANPVGYEVDRHLNAVGNLNKRNSTVHAVQKEVQTLEVA